MVTALSAPTLSAAAPPSVTLADGVADGRRFGAFVNTWRFYREHEDGSIEELGLWHDRVEIIHRAGVEILHRVQRTEPRDDRPALVVLNEMRRDTMAPIRSRFAHGSDSAAFLDVRFDGRTLTGTMPIAPADGAPMPVSFSLTTPEPVFDWTQWGLLLAALPLEEGYTARFTGFNNDPNQAPLLTVTVHVEGSERVPVPQRGDVECFVVNVHAGIPWTFWIAQDRRAGPPIIKIRIDDSPGQRRWWTPTDD